MTKNSLEQTNKPRVSGLDPKQLERLSRAIHKDIEEDAYNGGAIVVARNGIIGLHEAIGFANRKENRKLKLNDVFNILSVTKAFTDVLILSLIEKGKVALTTPVTEIIPELSGKDKKILTVFHLMTHTAGSPSVLFPVKPEKMGNIQAVIKAICSLDLVMEPGKAVSYSPLWGHALLGEIVRRLDDKGRSLQVIYQEDLFGPLGMKDTALGRRKDLSERIVPIIAHDPNFGDMTGEDVNRHNLFITETAEIPWMGGVSTAYDLFRFADMLRNSGEIDGIRILSPASVRTATSVQTGNLVNDYYVRVMKEHDVQPPPANIGLDFLIKGTAITPNSMGTLTSPGTFGKFGLGGTGFWVDPERGITFVFLRSGLLEHYKDTVTYQRLSDMAIAAAI
jgi:CubicO group peptidase (beta-lactamase class C family)